MSDLPERMWADLDHWTRREPTRPGYVEYVRADLLTAAQAIALERGEKLFAAQARIAELEAALRFYADEKNWEGQFNREPCETHHVFAFRSGPARRDGGRVARRALEGKA